MENIKISEDQKDKEEKIDSKKSLISLPKNIWRSIKICFPSAPWLNLVLLILVLVENILPFISSGVMAVMLNSIVESIKTVGAIENIFPLIILYVSTSVLPELVYPITFFVDKLAYFKISLEIEQIVLRKRAETDIAHLEDPEFQNLINRAFNRGFWPIEQIFSANLRIIANLFTLIVSVLISLHFNPIIFWIILFTLIPRMYFDIKMGKNYWDIWATNSQELRLYQEMRSNLTSRFAIIETKLFDNINHFLKKVRSIIFDFNQKQTQIEKKRLGIEIILGLVQIIGMTFCVFLVFNDMSKGMLEVGTTFFVIGALWKFNSSVEGLFKTLAGVYDTNQYVDDIFKVLDIPPVIVQAKKPKKLDLKNPPLIEIKNISFSYPKSKKKVLKNFSLIIEPGHKLGVVGLNGAGKTTLVRLICRIHDPTEGCILINGIDLREIDLNEWWNYLGVLFQDFTTHHFLAKEAIAIGNMKKDIDINNVIDASIQGQSHEFIDRWDKKYDHQIGVEFGGEEPSKGQRQKLALARVFYRKPLVLILDEPTASVDIQSEMKIFQNLESLSKEMTAILISHDFSAIKMCDEIVVIEDGKIIERGKHRDLIKIKGKYSDLFSQKASRFKK